jgi:hypothetical protein
MFKKFPYAKKYPRNLLRGYFITNKYRDVKDKRFYLSVAAPRPFKSSGGEL